MSETRIFAKNLPESFGEEDVYKLFGSFEIQNINFPRKGRVIITLRDHAAALYAIERTNQQVINDHGRMIRVELYRESGLPPSDAKGGRGKGAVSGPADQIGGSEFGSSSWPIASADRLRPAPTGRGRDAVTEEEWYEAGKEFGVIAHSK